jgi:hypothetical protein
MDAAFGVFKEVVAMTTVDSGQAALNWRIESYNEAPGYRPQATYWGTDQRSPTGGAGYKAIYEGYGPVGDADQIYGIAFSNGVKSIVAMRTRKFDGISVYNPITPGVFEGDKKYEFNALSAPRKNLSGVIDEAFYSAYAKAKVKYPDLLT